MWWNCCIRGDSGRYWDISTLSFSFVLINDPSINDDEEIGDADDGGGGAVAGSRELSSALSSP